MPAGSPDPWARWREVCSRCGRTWSLADRLWSCPCGGLLDLVGPLAGLSGGAGRSPLVRYGPALPPGAADVDLGMEVSPLVAAGPGRYMKVEYQQPTGSFKDRGAAVMIGVAARLGVRSIVVDSSGNAGKAAAAHSARAGMACTVLVPAGTPAPKVAAIASYGASVVEVPGGRGAAAMAARQAVGPAVTAAVGSPAAAGNGSAAVWYASHVHQPLFHHGVKTLAYELFEQLPGVGNGTVVVPAGNGTLVLGLWLGFGELVAAGRLGRRPAIVGVQASNCAPLLGSAPSGTATAAAGIAIPDPPRADQIRAAVRASAGRLTAVGEDEILAAGRDLAQRGFPVEPTGAVAWAAGPALDGLVEPPVVFVLTGR